MGRGSGRGLSSSFVTLPFHLGRSGVVTGGCCEAASRMGFREVEVAVLLSALVKREKWGEGDATEESWPVD